MPVDIVDESDYTALKYAAAFNRTNVVRFLLQKGAKVDKQSRHGCTALHYASRNNCTDVIRVLLKHGATRYIEDNHGRTPIDLAGKNFMYWNNIR